MRAHLLLATLAACAAAATALNLTAGQRCAMSLQPLVTTRGACDIPPDSNICPDACLAALKQIKSVADEDCLKELAKVAPADKDRAEHAAAVCLQQLPGMSPLPADAQLVSESSGDVGTTTTTTTTTTDASASGDSKAPSAASALHGAAGVVLAAVLAALLLA